MGITGAEVTKEVSDMVLMDDNFATIVRAIEYGRTLLGNIRNFIRFEFSTTVAALTSMFAAPLFGLPLPLNALQILWINIIMDGPPALALGVEPPAGDEMKRKPANPNEPFVTPRLFGFIMISGLMMASGTLAVLHLATSSGNPKAGTLAFTTFVMFQLFNAFNCRSLSRSAFKDVFTNRYLFLAVVASFFLQLLIIYNPLLQEIFHTVPLDAMDWLVVGAIASSIIGVEEIRKKLLSRKSGA
jgi:Ca2+-transporting ATPase